MKTLNTQYALSEMAEALEISLSGWHDHGHKSQRPRQRQDRELTATLEPLFEASRRTYGSPRLTHALRQSGRRCGKNRVGEACGRVRSVASGLARPRATTTTP